MPSELKNACMTSGLQEIAPTISKRDDVVVVRRMSVVEHWPNLVLRSFNLIAVFCNEPAHRNPRSPRKLTLDLTPPRQLAIRATTDGDEFPPFVEFR